jgi:hypothetical protein
MAARGVATDPRPAPRHAGKARGRRRGHPVVAGPPSGGRPGERQGFAAWAAVRVASRASRGGPGRLWPPRDARDVREIQGRSRVRHDLRTSVTGSHQATTRCTDLGPYRGVKSVSRDLGRWEPVTFHGPSSREARSSWRNAHAPRRSSRSLITSRTPGRLGHGHSLPGPWPRRPGPFHLRAPATGAGALADGLGGRLGFGRGRVVLVGALVRVGLGRQVATALGAGDQFVGGFALGNEA